MATWLQTLPVFKRSADIDVRIAREIVRTFKVRFAEINADPYEAVFAPGVPRLWSTYLNVDVTPDIAYVFDTGVIVQRLHAEQDEDDPHLITVTVTYASRTLDPSKQGGGQGSQGQSPNDFPLNEPPKVQWGVIHDTRVLRTEADPEDPDFATFKVRAVANSAGQPFQPRPTSDSSRLALHFQRNQATFDKIYYQDYWDSVNKSTFQGFAPGHARCAHITAEQQFRNNFPYWTVSYLFEFKLKPKEWQGVPTPSGGPPLGSWDLFPIDQGTRYKDDNDPPNLIPFVNGLPNGENLLDGQGKPLAQPPAGQPPPDPVVLAFYGYKRREFNNLAINLP